MALPIALLVVLGVISSVVTGAANTTGVQVQAARYAPDAAFQDTITISPDQLPAGQINVFYSVTISASGGTPGYTYSIEGSFPTELTFDRANGVISGTVTGVGTANFTVVVIDAAGNSARKDYSLTFTEDAPTDTTTADTGTSSEPLTGADIEATRIANLREALGPPVVVISTEIEFLAIRTGPFVGASLRNLAIRGGTYNAIGEVRPPGSQFSWYLIEYETGSGADAQLATGWVSGRFAQLQGFILDVPIVANPFDSITGELTGVTGVSVIKNNLYRYPAGSAPLVTRFDEGNTFEVLGRTVLDRRNFTYWILIRLDRTGQVGWTRFTPFVPLDGDFDAIPIY
ncbi:MAG: Ig domain-containing protein [Chloroflexota bacterium]